LRGVGYVPVQGGGVCVPLSCIEGGGRCAHLEGDVFLSSCVERGREGERCVLKEEGRCVLREEGREMYSSQEMCSSQAMFREGSIEGGRLSCVFLIERGGLLREEGC
jgi:hypothetical protein